MLGVGFMTHPSFSIPRGCAKIDTCMNNMGAFGGTLEAEEWLLVDDFNGRIGSKGQTVRGLMHLPEFVWIVLRWLAIGLRGAAHCVGCYGANASFRRLPLAWPVSFCVCSTTETVRMNVRRVADWLGCRGSPSVWRTGQLACVRYGGPYTPVISPSEPPEPRHTLLSGIDWQSQLGPPLVGY